MEAPWLNYHHLFYFWTVAREGGVSKAAARLRLSQPTISAQVRALERSLGETLLTREGRGVGLTDQGRLVFRFAEEIFTTGREMLHALAGDAPVRAQPLGVGVSDAVPKLIVYRILRPALKSRGLKLVCHEGEQEELLADLARHALDIVITDAPAPPHARVKVFNHLLGESETAFFAPPRVAAALRRRFPHSLDGAPMLLPGARSSLRREIDMWFDRSGIRPQVVGEFEDTALMKTFSHGTAAVFPAPAAISADVCRFYGVRLVGRTADVREKYFVISAERRITHPAVRAVTTAARDELFR